MSEKIAHNGKQIERGERVTTKKKTGWRLLTTTGKRRYFVASLIAEADVGEEQILVFRVNR